VIVLFLFFFSCLDFTSIILLNCGIYFVAGLCWMVETTMRQGTDSGAEKRVSLDHGLLATLVDKWCLKAHLFHLPWGEMTLTFEDVSYLPVLPIVGEAIEAVDVANT
jgi:hypothetical protein